MSQKVLNFGILGCGVIADFHAQAIRSLDNAKLIGAADNSPKRAEQFSEKYAIKKYESYEEMLADDNVDAVCICTPSGFHAQNAIDALNAAKHVVLEKPMALNSEDIERVITATKENNRLLTVISQLRFSSDIKRVKDLMAQNAFGKIVFCDLYMKYWRSAEYYSSSDWKGTLKFDGGGALMNQGIHGIDLLLYLAGNAKVLCSKNKTAFHDIEVEDASVSMLEFQNGAMGVIEGSTCACPGFERKIEIIGTEGSVVLKENKIEKLVVAGETLIDGITEELAGTANDPTAMSYELHALQLNNLINAVNGKEELLIDCYEGSRAVKLIEEIYKK